VFFTVVKVSYILTTCPCFDTFGFDMFDAGGPQCHFITSVTTAVRIRTLSVYLLSWINLLRSKQVMQCAALNMSFHV